MSVLSSLRRVSSAFVSPSILSILSCAVLFTLLSACSGDDDGDVSATGPLLKITVPSQALVAREDETLRVWAYLSDANGDMLGIKELQPGTEVTFDRPAGFGEKEFTLTYFTAIIVDYGAGYFTKQFSTIDFPHTPAGSWTYTGRNDAEPAYDKEIMFQLQEDLPVGKQIEFSGPSHRRGYVMISEHTGVPSTLITHFNATQNNVLLTLGTDDEALEYKFFGNLKAAEVLTEENSFDVSYSDFQTLDEINFPLNNASARSAMVYGYDDESDFRYYLMGWERGDIADDQDLTLKAPKVKFFKFYEAALSATEDGIVYNNFLRSDNLPSSFVRSNTTLGDYSITDNKTLNVLFSGEGDYGYVECEKLVITSRIYTSYDRGVCFPITNKAEHFTFPEIPQEILDVYSEMSDLPELPITYASAVALSYADSFEEAVANPHASDQLPRYTTHEKVFFHDTGEFATMDRPHRFLRPGFVRMPD